MSKVLAALAVSVDGYITGREPGPGRGLGDGSTLFDWYFDGDTESAVFGGFKLSEPSARVFDALAGRVGAVVAGRNTYDDSGRDRRGHGAAAHEADVLAAGELAGRRDRVGDARRVGLPLAEPPHGPVAEDDE